MDKICRIPLLLGLVLLTGLSCTLPDSPLATATAFPQASRLTPSSPDVTPLPASPLPQHRRADGAYALNISETGSLQNPAWSPDGDALLFTRFRHGYNAGPADLLVFDLRTNTVRKLVADGSANVNLPGAVWNPVIEQIVFSSSRGLHDEIYILDDGGQTGDEIQVTSQSDRMSYEPSFSPDGEWIVFEAHPIDVEDRGVIVKYRLDGASPYLELTASGEDCRQPNWSPAGDKILYQKFSDGQWDIWIMNIDGSGRRPVTAGPGDKTDASFSPDGQWIVYSSDEDRLDFANLFVIPLSGSPTLQITHFEGYDGAPSWSPDGKKIAFESFTSDPDGSAGTLLWVIDVPASLSDEVK